MNTSKKFGIVICIVTVLAIVLSVVALYVSYKPVAKEETEADTQYVLYLCTNDKDTNQPVFPPEEAKEQAKKILIEHFGGYERRRDGSFVLT